MARPLLKVNTLHGYTLEELVSLKNETASRFTRLALSVVTMRHRGYSNQQITDETGLCNSTISRHINAWNAKGIESVMEHRGGGKPPKLEPYMIEDLLHITLHKLPTDFEYIGHSWTCELLAFYIHQTYGVEVSHVTIWTTLKNNNLSYKRAQPKPTKANKAEQDAFKKNANATRYFRIFK